MLKFFRWFGKPRSRELEFICSDMWRPYLKVVAKKASQAVHVLDRFHIMSMMSKAIDKVRAEEAKQLQARGYEPMLNITRWSTAEERRALIQSLVEKGQDETVELLREQEETGWARTQTGAGMRGWPSTRLHYAYEFEKADGKRLVVLVAERTIGMAEAMRSTRSMDYQISAIVMELQKGENG